MPDQFDFKAGIREVLRVIAAARSIEAGMNELLTFCRNSTSEDPSLLEHLSQIDYPADAKRIAVLLPDLQGQVPADYAGLYFGLDGLNMSGGKGIEFGCSNAYRPGQINGDWPYACDLYPGDLPSQALSEAYAAGVNTAGPADTLVCLGYAGLALRRAFEVNDPYLLLGDAPERAVVWGWHDGDLFALGILRPDAFHLQLDQGDWLRA